MYNPFEELKKDVEAVFKIGKKIHFAVTVTMDHSDHAWHDAKDVIFVGIFSTEDGFDSVIATVLKKVEEHTDPDWESVEEFAVLYEGLDWETIISYDHDLL